MPRTVPGLKCTLSGFDGDSNGHLDDNDGNNNDDDDDNDDDDQLT